MLSRVGQALIFGLLGYSFPRLLIALGVPLDDIIRELGGASLEVVLWGFAVIAALVMVWLEGRFNLFERLFYAARPIKLSEPTMFKFIELIERSQMLLLEADRLDLSSGRPWQQRVIEWNDAVEQLVRENLPPNELFAYRTVTPRPEVGQRTVITAQILAGRMNKLRAMINRLMPPS